MTEQIVKKTLIINNKNGLHARPAALLVKTAGKFKSLINLSKDGLVVNAKSILGVMTLAAEFGSEIEIIATGEDAEQAVAAIEEVINSKFEEE
ncbi:MAG: HPr family phosphocarrier protein [Calditrichia bacterium]